MEPSKRRKADAVGDMVKTFVLSEHFMRAVKEFFGAPMGNGHQTTRRKGREATTAAGGLGRRRAGPPVRRDDLTRPPWPWPRGAPKPTFPPYQPCIAAAHEGPILTVGRTVLEMWLDRL